MKTTYRFLPILFLFFTFLATAQTEKAPILFIYDASGSMWGQMEGQTKIEIASKVLSSAINELPAEQAIGLMAYGHRTKGDCNDVELLIKLQNTAKAPIQQALKGIKPLGRTPLARSATLAIDQLRAQKKAATIILITDGIESCDGDLCAVVEKAKAEGIDFKLHIIGFGLAGADLKALKCAAQAGEGNYYDASDAGSLSEVLNEATNTTVDKPAGNFSVYAVKNGKVVDTYIQAYEAGTKNRVAIARSYQDSAWLYLPAGSYDLEAKPVAGDVGSLTVRVNAKGDTKGHQDISFDAAKFKIQAFNNEEGWDAVLKITDSKTGKVTAVGRTYGRVKELEVNPGTYHIDFQALVIKGLEIKHRIENVQIQAGETKDLSHHFQTGEARIGVKTGSELVDATVMFKDAKTGQNIAAHRTYTSASSNPKSFLLNPGTYEVTIITVGKHKGKKEIFQLTVEAGKIVERIYTF